MSEMKDQHLMLLGEIKGIVEGLKAGQQNQIEQLQALGTRVDQVDSRLRVVEQRSAVMGAVSGGAMAIGIQLIVESLKAWAGKGTPHP
jgi:hypothetical protein